MDAEDPEVGSPDDSEDETLTDDVLTEDPASKRTAGIGIVLAVLAAFGLAIYTGVAQTAAGLLVFPGIPLVLIWFVWRVFLRRLWRIRRIRNAQEKRELREAASRNKT